jgi:uncharacterized protein (DUF4415 family)
MKKEYDFSKAITIKGKIKSKSQIDKALAEHKTLTSIRLDNEIIEVAKKRAEAEGIGHLTWINKKLRNIILGEEDFEHRIKKLEKAVFKKKAKVS